MAVGWAPILGGRLVGAGRVDLADTSLAPNVIGRRRRRGSACEERVHVDGPTAIDGQGDARLVSDACHPLRPQGSSQAASTVVV